MTPRRLLVVFNPVAGRGRERRLAAILRALRRQGCAVEIRRAAARVDAERIADAAKPDGWDAVVAAGGDGTINELANGLARSGLPLGVVPLDTGNVLANEIGLPHRADQLARVLAFAPARPVWT